MPNFVYKPFYQSYSQILSFILQSRVELNKRTGVQVRVMRGGVAFSINLSSRILPTIGCRKTFPKSAAAEVAWYALGEQDATFIRKYAPLWDKFVEPIESQIDKTAFEGVKAAYGYRWRRHFGRDQLKLAVEALRKDPSDRRIYISAWDPAGDGLGVTGQRNVPCPVSFTFSITNNELHSSLFIRSSDVFVGLPYDVMGHALLMDAVARELGVDLGVLHVTLAHAHLYEVHWEFADTALCQDPVVPDIKLPGWPLSQIETHPNEYVVQYAQYAATHTWPKYSPRPEVVE